VTHDQHPPSHADYETSKVIADRVYAELEAVRSNVIAAIRYALPDVPLAAIQREIAEAALRWAELSREALGRMQKAEEEKLGLNELCASWAGDPEDEWKPMAEGTPPPLASGTPINGTPRTGKRGKR
jgi:hypothetical protein